MNKKRYASSVHSQKSTTSAKSGRSFLSFSSSALWKTTNKREGQQPQQKWYNLKSWIPSKGSDNDSIKNSIATTNSTNSSSLSKIKRLLFISSDSPKPPSSLTTITTASDSSSTNETSLETTYSPTIVRRRINGILINRDGESTDQHEKRKHKRRQDIMKLQEHHQHHFHFRRLDSKNHHNHLQENQEKNESSSSDTLLDVPEQKQQQQQQQQQQQHEHQYKKKSVSFGIFNGDEDDDIGDGNDDEKEENEWIFNPRIIFVEPSPVPRFRNVAPPPPPSPPYMNILIDHNEDDYRSSSSFQSIINTMDGDTNYDHDNDDQLPTVFTTKDNIIEQQQDDDFFFENEHERRISLLLKSLSNIQNFEKPRLYFKSPLHRGQILQFSLQNTIPEDHIIIFKFLTSNIIPTNSRQERYFIRPSAGMITSNKLQPIMLFLNEVPSDMVNKDRILVKWVAIQRNTRIEDWLRTLNENTRRKWIDMIQEEYPDQVVLRSTRIRVRFV